MNNYFMETHHHEWILTNKLGGYALGTGNLINQRKYHGLLIAGYPGYVRNHLLAGIEEKVEWRGENFHLDSNNYSNCIYPEGFLYLVKPWLLPFPSFLYSSLPHNNDILIQKVILFDTASNTVLIRYKNLGQHKLHLELHPKFTMHNHHEVNISGSVNLHDFELKTKIEKTGTYSEVIRHSKSLKVYGYFVGAELNENRYVYDKVFFPWDAMKGYEGISDQVTLYELRVTLLPGEEKILLFSDIEITNPEKLVKSIVDYYDDLPLPHDYPTYAAEEYERLEKIDFNDGLLFNRIEYLHLLQNAMNQYIQDDDVTAGFPWYETRSADTMFFLKAYLSEPGNLKKAENIIENYHTLMHNNMLPANIGIPASPDNPISLEATFGFIEVLARRAELRKTKTAYKNTISVVKKTLSAVLNNNTYPFHVTEAGLIMLHDEYAGATWMNSSTSNGWAVPRSGAPVEINAMWYNALNIYKSLVEPYRENHEQTYKPDKRLLAYLSLVSEGLQGFIGGKALCDLIKNSAAEIEHRPNALIAASQKYTPFNEKVLSDVFTAAFSELYTVYGLRSLNPQGISFHKKYYGIQQERDAAMHNGSVWAWLLGPFCELYIKLKKGRVSDQTLFDDIDGFIGSFRKGFMKGHISSVAEIWDGDSPHFPKGSPAFARSVAALYRIEMLIEEMKR